MFAAAEDFPLPFESKHTQGRREIQNRDAMYFERRASERHECSGRVTALVTGPRFTAGNRNRICSLQLQNISDTGLGGISQDPLEIGAQITVFIAPHGAEKGYDLHGTVVRCNPASYGQSVGIRFVQRMAA